VGKAEAAFLDHCNVAEKKSIFDRLLANKPPVIILARELTPYPELLKMAKRHEVPILGTLESTSVLISKIIAFLNLRMAPRITRHGALIEVYGEGMLILGESGVGKSETTIELVKRGHRLVADDAVEIRKTSNITLVGSSPDNIRHFMELRGIGIINARQLFGIGAVKLTEKINMVVELELWNPDKVYDRMGLDNHFMAILGVKVPRLVVPVKPGRNLAVILEVAAMNNRQKRMGYNAAQDLMEQLGLSTESATIIEEWNDG
jgi:HPr kinase/phosphorylase